MSVEQINCNVCKRKDLEIEEIFGECADCELIMCNKCEGIICEETGETYCRECYKKYSECCLCNKDIQEIKDEDKWTINECGACQKNFCGECFENNKGRAYDGHGDLYYLRHNGYCCDCLEEMNSSECGSDYYSSEEDDEEVDFEKLTVKELKELCKKINIKGYSKLKKQQLLDLLENHYVKCYNCKCDGDKDELIECDGPRCGHYLCEECDNVGPCQCDTEDDIEEDKEYECGKCCITIHHYTNGNLDYTHCEECDEKLCENCFDSRDENGDCGFCYDCYLKTTDINKLKVKELKSLCKLKEIKGYSKLKKQQLLELLKR